MSRFTREDVAAEAQKRWSRMHAFDIESTEWDRICKDNHPADVMAAIQKTKGTVSRDPAAVHSSLVYWLNRFATERKALATWPPTCTKQIQN